MGSESNKDREQAQLAKLETRIDELEKRLQNPPVSRRAALAGGAGLVGLSALSGSASAGSNQVGTIGSSTDRVDIFAEDLDVSGDITGVNSGREWVDEVSNRSINTTFTNSSDSEIAVNVVLEVTSGSSNRIAARFKKPTTNLSRTDLVLDKNRAIPFQTIVPAGSEYELQVFFGSSIVDILHWFELK